MCRGKHDGGRRCPGCMNTRARQAHNRRRRENRKIRKQIMGWAGENAGEETREHLQGLPADRLKAWAEERGVPPELLRADEASAPGVKAPGLAAVGGGAGGGVGAGGGGRGGRTQALPQPPLTAEAFAAQSQWEGVSAASAPRVAEMIKQQGKTFQERALMRTDSASRSAKAFRGGVNETVKLEYEDGTTGYFKPFDGLDERCARDYGQEDNLQPLHEAAAWQLAREMGPPHSQLVAPCVMVEYEGSLGSVSYGVPGRPGHAEAAPDEQQLADAAFFDCLIGQQDRHEGNYLVDNRGITLIDHGFGFSRPGTDVFNVSRLVERRHLNGEGHLSRDEIGKLSAFLDSPNGHGMKDYLEPERYKAMKWRARQMLEKGRVLRVEEMDFNARR